MGTRIDGLLTGQVELEMYSQAHPQNTVRRIDKMLEAQVTWRTSWTT
ncbi:MAG: hypothetical protein KDA92_11765 [Planctomycetales bacterium]|nr:hypothetical protein [Planctomycetales bacterium]